MLFVAYLQHVWQEQARFWKQLLLLTHQDIVHIVHKVNCIPLYTKFYDKASAHQYK